MSFGAERRAARRLGIRAERLAEWWLRAKLFRIVARNYRVRDGEIDLIVQRGGTVAFVEVKARPHLTDGLESVSVRKQRRIARAARHWLAANPWAASRTLRGDGLIFVPRRLPKHVPNLFELDLG